MFVSQQSLKVILAALCLIVGTQAAVIRNSAEETMDKVESTTLEMVTEEAEVTTVESIVDETSSEDLGALTRDEEASILIIDQTLLDPAPAESKQSASPVATEQKFGKLLLLSTPKLVEKSKLPEENFEESEETIDTAENSTDVLMETTTTAAMEEETTTMVPETAEDEVKDEEVKEAEAKNDEAKESETKGTEVKESETMETEVNESASETKKENEYPETPVEPMEAIPITKLYPINDTLYEESKKLDTQESSEPMAIVVDEEPKDNKNSNFGAVIFSENEADYVLVDSDTEIVEEGVYADVDSDLHLQPIVQSLEIVPTSVDDSLLVNYVHHW